MSPSLNASLYDDDEQYNGYISRFEATPRKRKEKKPNHKAKKTEQAIIEEIAETRDLEGMFKMTYHPSLFEEGWLLDALNPFFTTTFITDVMSRVKGGKEASVYRCEAHPSTGETWLASKVYRPRMFRNLRNDALYREGRQLVGQDGKEIKGNNARAMRAIHKKSSFGEKIRGTSWLTHEYRTLQTLYDLGADVPKPYAIAEEAILMTYLGDENGAAPPLSDIRLDKTEAKRLFEQVLHNLTVMLDQNIVHGDLSAFNILYWDGDITLIDFPQVVDPHINNNARIIFERDVTRVCEYFQRQGVRCDAKATAKRIWTYKHDESFPIDYDLLNE